MNQKNNWVDYKELKERVTIREILNRYGLLSSIKEKKGYIPTKVRKLS